MVPEEWVKTLGEAIRDHRKAAGLTQLELAEIAAVGKSAVFDIEKGKPTVQLETLLRVLAALNMELHWRSPMARDPHEESRHA